jgi:hypothetical protein
MEEEKQATVEPSPVKRTFGQRIKKNLKDYFHPEGIQQEMLRYKKNSVAKYCVFIALICCIVAFSVIYSYIKTVTWTTAIDILGSVLILLFSFSCAMALENYYQKWAYGSFVLGLFAIVRIFTYPIFLIIPTFNKVETNMVLGNGSAIVYVTTQINQVLDDGRFSLVVILYSVAAFFYIIGGVLTLIRGNSLKRFLATQKLTSDELVKEK